MRRLCLVPVVLFALMVSPLLAAPIVVFNFETNLAPSLVDPEVTASNVTPAPANANLSVTQTVNSLLNGELRMAGITTAVTRPHRRWHRTSSRLSRSRPHPGWLMDLSRFDLLIARGGASTPRGFVLRSSVDGFASDLFSGDSTVVRPVYRTRRRCARPWLHESVVDRVPVVRLREPGRDLRHFLRRHFDRRSDEARPRACDPRTPGERPGGRDSPRLSPPPLRRLASERSERSVARRP